MSAKTSILWYLMFNRQEVWRNTQKLNIGLVFLARREKNPAMLSCLKHHYLWCLLIFHTWKPVTCLQEKYSSFLICKMAKFYDDEISFTLLVAFIYPFCPILWLQVPFYVYTTGKKSSQIGFLGTTVMQVILLLLIIH